MRLHRIADGHVVLRHRPALRWVLLALGVLFTWWALATAFDLGFRGGPMLATVLSVLLLFGGVYAVRSRVEIEVWPDGVRWSRRRPFGARDTDLWLDRDVVRSVRLYAGVVPGTLEKESSPRMSYEVELCCREPLPRSVAIYCHHRESRARRYASELCRTAGLPLVDATGERQEVRHPDGLGGRPAERAAAPGDPPPKNVRVDPDPLHGEVAVLSRWTGARVTLHLADGELVVVRSWFAVPLRRRRLPIEAIERVRVQRRPSEDGPGGSRYLRAGVGVVAAQRTVVFGGWLTVAARRWVAAWLESRLWPELPVASVARSTSAGSVPVLGTT